MNLHEASLELKKGQRVRRKGWIGSWLERARNYDAFARDGRSRLGAVEFVHLGGRAYTDWVPDLADLCADDWEVVL